MRSELRKYPHPGPEFEWFTNTSEALAAYHWNVDRKLQDQQHKAYLARWTKGPPKATEKHAVEQLEGCGMFGLYSRKDGSDWDGAFG